jgi:hypothetical protein
VKSARPRTDICGVKRNHRERCVLDSYPLTKARQIFRDIYGLRSRPYAEGRTRDRALDTLVCSAFGLQALQEIEPRQRPTGLLDQPAIAQIA